MHVVIAGGHGKIARRLTRLLVVRGDGVSGIVRNPAHADDLRVIGADAVVMDLEQASPHEVAAVVAGADAMVFAAGAGPGSGTARKDTVDRAAAATAASAAEIAGVRRHLQISSMGLDRVNDQRLDEVFRAYLAAKDAAERDLRERNLDWTILRPGRLTDEPGTGRVRLADAPIPGGVVSRDDVAAVLEALLDEPATTRRTLELVSGPTTIADAVQALARVS
jgi:uncharacterized protein YbjT (DUF2867 family)